VNWNEYAAKSNNANKLMLTQHYAMRIETFCQSLLYLCEDNFNARDKD